MNDATQEQQFDDEYSQEIIAKARELSPELDEYIVTQHYLIETPQENVSPMWLRNRLMTKIFEQLVEMGIEINMDVNQALDDPVMVLSGLTLRSKFDGDRMYEFLKSHRDLAEQIREILGQDSISEICTLCYSVLPLDEGWETLDRIIHIKPGILSSGDTFTELMANVFERLDRLGEPDMTEEVDVEDIAAYTQLLQIRKAKILELAQIIYANKDESAVNPNKARAQAVATAMKGFEKELTRNKYVVRYVQEHKNIREMFTVWLNRDIRPTLKPMWKHTLEYWMLPVHKTEVPSELVAAIMIATMYYDHTSKAEAKVHIAGIFESVKDMLGDRYVKFRELVDNAIANLVMVDGGMSHAVK